MMQEKLNANHKIAKLLNASHLNVNVAQCELNANSILETYVHGIRLYTQIQTKVQVAWYRTSDLKIQLVNG